MDNMVHKDHTSMPLFYRRALLAAFLALLPINAAFAQAQSTAVSPATGEIRLRVKDTSGRPVRAQATLHGPSLASSRKLEVQSDGSLTVPNLPFGTYQVDLVQTGFAPNSVTFQIKTAKPV